MFMEYTPLLERSTMKRGFLDRDKRNYGRLVIAPSPICFRSFLHVRNGSIIYRKKGFHKVQD